MSFDFIKFEQKVDQTIKPFNRLESEIINRSIYLYKQGDFWSAGTLAIQLYEMRLTRFFIRRTSNPTGFVPSKDNLAEQIENLRKREHEIIENKSPFKSIAKQCKESGLISRELEKRAVEFYKKIRIPVSHGLINRLTERYTNEAYKSEFHTDMKFDEIAELMCNEALHELEHLFEETAI